MCQEETNRQTGLKSSLRGLCHGANGNKPLDWRLLLTYLNIIGALVLIHIGPYHTPGARRGFSPKRLSFSRFWTLFIISSHNTYFIKKKTLHGRLRCNSRDTFNYLKNVIIWALPSNSERCSRAECNNEIPLSKKKFNSCDTITSFCTIS